MDGVIEAEVQVGDRTVRYLRAGRGSAVLLLLGPSEPGNTESAAFSTLARDHRVFRPTTGIPGERSEAERWLSGLVEGLGLHAPDVVAAPELAPLLARLVRRNDGLVGQVLFLAPRRRG